MHCHLSIAVCTPQITPPVCRPSHYYHHYQQVLSLLDDNNQSGRDRDRDRNKQTEKTDEAKKITVWVFALHTHISLRSGSLPPILSVNLYKFLKSFFAAVTNRRPQKERQEKVFIRW